MQAKKATSFIKRSFEEVIIVGYTIAMAGKGGTGKTTLAGLMVRYLIEHNKKPVLAVDADANSNLANFVS